MCRRGCLLCTKSLRGRAPSVRRDKPKKKRETLFMRWKNNELKTLFKYLFIYPKGTQILRFRLESFFVAI